MKKALPILLVAFAVSLAFAPAAFADEAGGGGSGSVPLPNPLKTDNIVVLLEKITGAIVKFIAPPIAVLMVIIGAFMILTAGGNPEQVKKGRQTLIWTAVGFGIILLANLLLKLIRELLNTT